MMDNSLILEHLFEHRSNCFFVPVAESDKVCAIASALANKTGGTVVAGMDSMANAIGLKEGEANEINASLLKMISPSLPYTSTLVSKDGRDVLVISVWEGGNKPYSVNGIFYSQIGEGVVRMSPEQMAQIFENRERQENSWERETISDAVEEDIRLDDLERLKSFLVKDEKVADDASAADTLKALGFIRKGDYTNACMVVIGKQPSYFFPQTRIRVSVFGENNELENVKLFDSGLIDTIDKIVEYVYSFYPSKIVVPDLERKECESLPKVALREGLLNACVHRTYDDYSSFVKVNVYPDYLEIVNSGELLKGVSIADFDRKHDSMLRNPDIANAFFVLRYIETAGSGTVRIFDECRRNFCNEPEWYAGDGVIRLVFRVDRPVIRRKKDRAALVEGLTSDPAVRESLTAILEYLDTHNNVKNTELSVLISKSYATTKRYMQTLKDAGVIEYKGSLKTGGWHIVSQ